MTQQDLFQTAISLQPDTPASPSPLPGSKEARKMTAISGRKYFRLFKQNAPLGLFARMFLDTSVWASTRCYLTWKIRPVTQSKHFVLELCPSMPRTADSESGLLQEMWATPNTMDHLPQRSLESMMKRANGQRKGRTRPSNLREQVNPETVNLHQIFMWPTPTAVDYKGARKPESMKKTGRNPMTNSLKDAVEHENPTGSGQLSGSLNPTWVEWLMGYPEGWTDLKG